MTTPEPDDAPVPRLPRGRGFKLSSAQLVKIAMTLALLILIIATQRQCANAVSKFVTGFGDQGSASQAMPKPGAIDVSGSGGSAAGAVTEQRYERITPEMTPDQVKAAIERARAKAGVGPGSGAGWGSASGAQP